MKKALLVMLIAVIAVTSVFAYSDVTAKVGYDLMSFASSDKDVAYKVNGLSFGFRGDVDVINGVCVTASVDGIVPFFVYDGESWEKINFSKARGFGLKAKLGASYEIDFGRVDLALGVNGIYGVLFEKLVGESLQSMMNAGIGADVCVDFNVTPHLTLGFELQPELMFPKTWTISEGECYPITGGSVQFAGSAQVAATVIF